MIPPARRTAEPNADAQLSPFYDPRAGWRNDDLLVEQSARDALGAQSPEALRVMDWPELRASFKRHDPPANRHGKRDRRFGLASIALGSLGLVLAAFAPLAGSREEALGVAAVALTVTGTAIALFHSLGARSKSRWLGHRYWTEVSRLLYFQVLVNNLDLAARAMRDDAAYAELLAIRVRALADLPGPIDLPDRLRRVAEDIADSEVWLRPEWGSEKALPTPGPDLDLLFALLRSQRFDIQVTYSGKKLGDSLRAPRRASEYVRLAGDVFSFLAVGLATVVGGLLIAQHKAADPPVKLALALAATASAVVLALRAMNEGLLLNGDTARYAWYNTAVQKVRADFDHGDVAAKVEALRNMERLGYRELRTFLADHWRARYVM